MYHDGINNIVALIIGISLIIIGIIVAFLFERKLFKKNHKIRP